MKVFNVVVILILLNAQCMLMVSAVSGGIKNQLITVRGRKLFTKRMDSRMKKGGFKLKKLKPKINLPWNRKKKRARVAEEKRKKKEELQKRQFRCKAGEGVKTTHNSKFCEKIQNYEIN